MQRRILVIPFLLLFALCASGFQQIPSNSGAKSTDETHASMLGLMRAINTIEFSEKSEHGSYASWPVLLQHNTDYFNDWLSRFGPAEAGRGTPQHFSDLPEVLHGWKLRLNVNADGHGYSVLLEDAQDKGGFAFVSDERGIIRESKYIY